MNRVMKPTLVALILFASTALAADLPRVYIESAQAEDDRNWKKGGTVKQVDFGFAIAAALTKKKVPVTVVTDKTKSQWTIKAVSAQREDSTVTKVAKIAVIGVFAAGSFTKFEGAFQVVDNESSAIIFAYNVKKNNFQSAAEAFAKHFKKGYLSKRRRK